MKSRKVRYAVVGLGWFAQEAILPAFAKAKGSSLVALVSGDGDKRAKLGEEYGVKTYSYDDYDALLASGEIDAVYIALPNTQHAEYTVRAARAGVHVLCEKPMAVTEDECRQMMDACREAGVKLMIAYRLHFEEANLSAVKMANDGTIGDARLFDAVFAMQVKEGNTRLDAELGAGPLYDIGIYCINAARYVFRAEPTRVSAFTATDPSDPRFDEVEAHVTCLLEFPGHRLATFVASFGVSSTSRFEVHGTGGKLVLEPAFSHNQELRRELSVDGKTQKKKFKRRDQIAPELQYFSECVVTGRDPEPSGEEGLADVHIIRALHESARTGQSVDIEPLPRPERPKPEQEEHVPPHEEPDLVHAESPH